MHDPSGCNSTYNTHDEIRWYDQDSLIFISGLTDIDAIMGNDEKFLQDIEEAAKELKPKFIALASSPIPFMNGTDFPGLARALTARTGIPAFSVPTSGMHDYVYGAGLALAEIAGHFTGAAEKTGRCSEAPTESAERSTEKRNRKLNLLGATPLDLGPQSAVDAMKKRLKNYGWEILSTWAMGDTLEALSRAGEAAVNLVVSSVGIPAANVLKEKFGTPYVYAVPYGYSGTVSFLEQVGAAVGKAPEPMVLMRIKMKEKGMSMLSMFAMMGGSKPRQAAIKGDYDLVQGVGAFLEQAGISVTHKMCAHSLKAITEPAADVEAYAEEGEWLQKIRELRDTLLFADDVALTQADASNTKVLISAPFMNGVVATHLPFMGEKGADFLLEQIQGYYQK